MKVNKQGLTIFFVCIAIISIMFYQRSIQIDKVEKFGFYQIAFVHEKTQAKNGTNYRFIFESKGIQYEGNILSSGLDSVFIIKFLPDNPKVWMVAIGNPSPCMVSIKYGPLGLKTLPDSCD